MTVRLNEGHTVPRSRYNANKPNLPGNAVYSLEILMLAILSSLLVGAVVGLVTSKRLSPDTRKQRELERSLERLSEQQKDYQHEVVEHFTDTAKLLNNLAESYRDVHNHLAAGADKLTDQQVAEVIQPLPEGRLTEMSAEQDPNSLQQPLDYAPKSSPFETGTLNEEFGLDKKASNEAELAELGEVIPDIPLVEEANGRG